MHSSRLEALRQLQSANGVACVALVPGANLRYFTGLTMHLSERPTVAFVPTEGPLILALPVLEAPAAQAHLPEDAQLFTYSDEEGHEHVFHQVAEELQLEGQAYRCRVLGHAPAWKCAVSNRRFRTAQCWLPSLGFQSCA